MKTIYLTVLTSTSQVRDFGSTDDVKTSKLCSQARPQLLSQSPTVWVDNISAISRPTSSKLPSFRPVVITIRVRLLETQYWRHFPPADHHVSFPSFTRIVIQISSFSTSVLELSWLFGIWYMDVGGPCPFLFLLPHRLAFFFAKEMCSSAMQG